VVSFEDEKILLENNGAPFLIFKQATISYGVDDGFMPNTKVLTINSLSGSFITPHLILFCRLPENPGSLTEVLDLGEIALDGKPPFTISFSPISNGNPDYVLKPINDSENKILNIKMLAKY
jgi:hypothetical protein